MSGYNKRSERVQYAALPWRKSKKGIQVLLVTTRTQGKWIIPKGWPMKRRAPPRCAAQEALEEAGVRGTVAPSTLGHFRYQKRRKSGEVLRCTVHVFSLRVTVQEKSWSEQADRKHRWCSPADALGLVQEPGLRRLIRGFERVCQNQN